MASGTGPGPITADGCAVDLYAVLPVQGEPQIVAAVAAPGARILELGCGAGRVTHPLLDLGYDVTAVDSSLEMLAHVRGARTIHSTIEELRLDERFEVVLLASHLINTPLTAERAAFLDTCARHVAPEGAVLIERHEPKWFDTVDETWTTAGGIQSGLRDIRRWDDTVAATADYRVGDSTWTHSFVARRVDDVDLAALLTEHGLALDGFLDEASRWVKATVA